MVKPKILAVIPARSGSKSIPNKNIKLLGGTPLIAYSIMAALQSDMVTRTIVSTDSEEIAEIARIWGAEVPFKRPAKLSADLSPDLPVFLHAMRWLADNENYYPQIIVQLRPTSPFRPLKCVDEAIEMLIKNSYADSVRAVTPSGQNPYKMWHIDKGVMIPLLHTEEYSEPYNMPRQELPITFWQTGHVEAIRSETIMNKNSMTGETIIPYHVNSQYAIDLDTPQQWMFAEYLLENNQLCLNMKEPPVKRQLANIRLLVLDFDGVMTDNRVWVDQDGREAVVCSREDGLGFDRLKAAGISIMVLSSETNGVVQARCEKLGLSCRQGIRNKGEELTKIAEADNITLKQVAYIGNDINDLDCLRLVGLPVAVADAHPLVRSTAKWILNKTGGRGAIREFVELILKEKGTQS